MEQRQTFPVKMYRGGEPPRTVNAQSDFEYMLKDGWSLQPVVYSHQIFPTVLYQVGGKSKTVNSQNEYDELLKAGWSADVPVISEEDSLRQQIKYHQNEVERLSQLLRKVNPVPVETEGKSGRGPRPPMLK